MSKATIFLIFLIVIWLPQQSRSNTAVQQAFDDAEGVLQNLVNRAVNLYSGLCSGTTQTCETKIFNECSNIAPELTCESGFIEGVGCEASGTFMSWQSAGGRCSNSKGTCGQQEDKQLACAMAPLFEDNNLGENIKHDKQSPVKFQYVGFRNSFRMIYPYVHSGYTSGSACQDYDPRFRPWYVGAASGPKNVILIFDKSGSMDIGRMSLAKEASLAVLDTLGNQDWFGVIYFGNDASILTVGGQTVLQPATQDNIDYAKSQINSMSNTGRTNYEDALTKAYDMITRTTDQEFGSSCENIILFLTDGYPTEANTANGALKFSGHDLSDTVYNTELPGVKTATTDLITQLETDHFNSSGKKPKIFAYALSSEAKPDIPRLMSCSTNGLFFEIDENDPKQLIEQMRSYYDYLSLGVNANRSNKFYSEIYQDSITRRDFITISQPIFIENEAGVNTLLGVGGVDLDVASLNQLGDYNTLYQQKLRSSRTTCSTLSSEIISNECQHKSIRQKDSNGAVYTCDDDSANNCSGDETAYIECTVNEYTSATTQYVDTYPRVNGQQIKYTDEELSPCCPVEQAPIVVEASFLNSQVAVLSLFVFLSAIFI